MSNSLRTIQNVGSEGFEIELTVDDGIVIDANGTVGTINKTGYISQAQKLYFENNRHKKRLLMPMLREGSSYVEISFDEAFNIIKDRIVAVGASENLFLVSSTLTNEELYSAQKLAREAVGTFNINSVQYWSRSTVADVSIFNVSLCELDEAQSIVVYDFDQLSPAVSQLLKRRDKGVVKRGIFGKEIFRYLSKIILNKNSYDVEIMKSIPGFDDFKKRIESETHEDLFGEVAESKIKALFEERTVYVFNEESVDLELLNEIINFLLLKGQLGQLYSGVMVVRSECNSEGVFDMGCIPELRVGRKVNDKSIDNVSMLDEGKIRNLFIFDNADHDLRLIDSEKAEFVMCQRAFIDDQCSADLILPSSFHYEIGGTFTNTCHNIQQFGAIVEDKLEYNSLRQYARLCEMFGVKHPSDSVDIFMEIIALLKKDCKQLPFDSLIKNKQ